MKNNIIKDIVIKNILTKNILTKNILPSLLLSGAICTSIVAMEGDRLNQQQNQRANEIPQQAEQPRLQMAPSRPVMTPSRPVMTPSRPDGGGLGGRRPEQAQQPRPSSYQDQEALNREISTDNVSKFSELLFKDPRTISMYPEKIEVATDTFKASYHRLRNHFENEARNNEGEKRFFYENAIQGLDLIHLGSRNEIGNEREVLRHSINRPIDYLTYTNGNHNPSAIQLFMLLINTCETETVNTNNQEMQLFKNVLIEYFSTGEQHELLWNAFKNALHAKYGAMGTTIAQEISSNGSFVNDMYNFFINGEDVEGIQMSPQLRNIKSKFLPKFEESKKNTKTIKQDPLLPVAEVLAMIPRGHVDSNESIFDKGAESKASCAQGFYKRLIQELCVVLSAENPEFLKLQGLEQIERCN